MTVHDDLNERTRGALLDRGIDPRQRDNAAEVIDELRRQAESAGFRRLSPHDEHQWSSDGKQCEVWGDDEGRLVNLWIEDVTGTGLADGGLGFDDQTDWYDAATTEVEEHERWPA
jgi:hypothetical protein